MPSQIFRNRAEKLFVAFLALILVGLLVLAVLVN